MPYTNDSPPAFPSQGSQPYRERGMSLRDYFAGQALTALPHARTFIGEAETAESFRVLALHAYRTADAMLEARKE